MRTKSLKKNKINVVTLGCSKNVYDSEVLMGQLKANNKEVVHEEEGNIVVINTCGFINNAKEESVNTILEYVQKKEEGAVDKVFVTGCLSERYKPDLQKEIPDVDQYFGTTELPRLLKALGADYKHELIGERLTTTPKNYAYLKIAEGCDRPCSFCAIPLMRGSHKSTPIEELVVEAEKLATNGVKELILIAQDLTYYGLDLYKKRNLAELLQIRTTLIVGYPGETEEDFEILKNWVKEMRFERLGCFTYSHEENTHAFNLEDDVLQEVKQERANEIMEIQSQISWELNQQKIGKEFKVVIDRKEGDYFVGRTEFDSPDVDNEVLINASETYLKTGEFANVKITDAADFDLYAEVV